MLSRSEAKEKVQEYKRLLEPFMNKELEILFDQHKAPGTLQDIIHARVTGHKLIDSRVYGEKNYNPQIMSLEFSTFKLTFVLEDIKDIILGLNTFDIVLDSYSVQGKLV